MFCVIHLLILLVINSHASNHIFDNSRQKYEQILSSSTTSTCWQEVLSSLHDYCSIDKLDKHQSYIAYQFTICHLSTMNNDLSNIQCQENNIESCIKAFHQHMNAFIAYTEFYPFVQSICYVLREKSFQSELTSHLLMFLNNSNEIVNQLISSNHIQRQLTDKIKHQQYIQETILQNSNKLKQLARSNIDKTQDLLTNIIQAARHEYDLLKQICALSQTIQTIVQITCTYSFWFYVLSMFVIHVLTIPKRTNRARSILFAGMFLYVFIERYYQTSLAIEFYQCRFLCWIFCIGILIRYAYKYQSEKEIHHEQLHRLTTDLIQTEATFYRVSRELNRARSKSRSRSRSMRARRREQRNIFPLAQDKSSARSESENKENSQPIIVKSHLIDDEEDDCVSLNSVNKRHFSLLLSSTSKPVRTMLGQRQNNS